MYVINYLVNQKFLSVEFEQNNFLSIQVQKHSSALIENQWPYRRSARQDSNCLFTTFLQLICCSSKKVQGSRFLLHVCVKCFFFAIIMQLCCSMLKWKTGLTGAMLGDILKAFPTPPLFNYYWQKSYRRSRTKVMVFRELSAFTLTNWKSKHFFGLLSIFEM